VEKPARFIIVPLGIIPRFISPSVNQSMNQLMNQ